MRWIHFWSHVTSTKHVPGKLGTCSAHSRCSNPNSCWPVCLIWPARLDGKPRSQIWPQWGETLVLKDSKGLELKLKLLWNLLLKHVVGSNQIKYQVWAGSWNTLDIFVRIFRAQGILSAPRTLASRWLRMDQKVAMTSVCLPKSHCSRYLRGS